MYWLPYPVDFFYKIAKGVEEKEEGKQAVGRERTESLISYFANETFQNATINDPEFEDFSLAKDETYEWNDVLGQKALVFNYWILINQPNY